MGRFSGKKCRLISMLALTGGFFLVEIVVGYLTNSMALVADSFHMLSDVAALAIAFVSVKMSPKKWSKNTFGWARAEVLGALVNAVFLIALCFSILVESLNRFYEPKDIHEPQLLLGVGIVGLLINVVGLFLFHSHGHSHGHGHDHGHGHVHAHRRMNIPKVTDLIDDNEDDSIETDTLRANGSVAATYNDKELESHLTTKSNVTITKTSPEKKGDASQMNMKGVFLHILADALGSIIVCCSALIIWLTDWEWKFYVDPSLSIALVVLIFMSTWPLLVESALILLQTVPTHIKVGAIQQKLLTEIDGVLAVHEFHVWQLAGDRIIASAHIRCRNIQDYMRIAERVKELFHDQGIHSTTIQPEFVEIDKTSDGDCILDCPSDKNCGGSTCCPKDSPRLSHNSADAVVVNQYQDQIRQRTANSAHDLSVLESGTL